MARKTALAVVDDSASNAALVPLTALDDQILAYTQERDEFLSTSFAHARTIAQQRIPFSLLRSAIRDMPDLEQPDVMRSKILWLVELQAGYFHTDEGTGEVNEFAAGDQHIIALDSNEIRLADKLTFDTFLAEHGRIPNMTLQQYPARKKGHSPSTGLVHYRMWKPLSEMR